MKSWIPNMIHTWYERLAHVWVYRLLSTKWPLDEVLAFEFAKARGFLRLCPFGHVLQLCYIYIYALGWSWTSRSLLVTSEPICRWSGGPWWMPTRRA